MINKQSKVFLNFLCAQPDKEYLYYDGTEYPDELGDETNLFALAAHLEREGFAELIRADRGTPLGLRLTYKGMRWKEFRGLERRERWLQRLYGFISGVLVTVAGGFILKLLSG